MTYAQFAILLSTMWFIASHFSDEHEGEMVLSGFGWLVLALVFIFTN